MEICKLETVDAEVMLQTACQLSEVSCRISERRQNHTSPLSEGYWYDELQRYRHRWHELVDRMIVKYRLNRAKVYSLNNLDDDWVLLSTE